MSAITHVSKQVLVSGIAASGRLHIGNYIGALRQWVAQQGDYDCFWFVADLHALTVPHDIKGLQLAESTRHMAALYIAAGLDPTRSVLFRQSDVRAHTELNWLLACITPTGWLNRMTQFKAKSQTREAEKISAGLYSYPVLQAADILLYQAHHVPVGEDQRQHVELARDITQRFNSLFGEVFTEPTALIPEAGARIMGLDDPESKMSKTLAIAKQGHGIGLLDPPDQARKAIMRAQTDSGSDLTFATAGAGVRNLLTIYQALTGKEQPAIEAEFAGQGYGSLKRAVANAVVETLTPIQKRYHELADDRTYLDGVLRDGAVRATAVAEQTLRRVREVLGLDPGHLV
jgi:tryptophanyl-tRNA synthetase